MMKIDVTKFFATSKRKFILIGSIVVLIGVFFLGYNRANIEDLKAFASKPPPPAILQTQSIEQISAVGTYCWSGGCADMIGIPTPKEAIVASSQFVATLRLPINASPNTLEIRVNSVSEINELQANALNYRWWEAWQGKYNSLSLEKEQTINLELEQGLYVISVFAQWNQRGDVIYGFLVEVK